MLGKVSAVLVVAIAAAARVSGQCVEVHMEGFTAIDCRPQKDDTAKPPPASRPPQAGGSGDRYEPAPAPPGASTGSATSFAGDEEKYKKFRERSPSAGVKKTAAAPITTAPQHHEGEYRIATRGGTVYWSRERPTLKSNIYSFQTPNGVLVAVKKSEVETIDPPPPATPPGLPK